MTEERFNEIDKMFSNDVNFDIWDPSRILECASFTIGYLCGKGISNKESAEFIKKMVTSENLANTILNYHCEE